MLIPTLALKRLVTSTVHNVYREAAYPTLRT